MELERDEMVGIKNAEKNLRNFYDKYKTPFLQTAIIIRDNVCVLKMRDGKIEERKWRKLSEEEKKEYNVN